MPPRALFHTPLATVSWTWGARGRLWGAVVGEIDATNRVEVIREVRDRLGDARVRAVEIDAARLTFCDARSLLGLTAVTREVAARGLPLEVKNMAPHLVRLLDLLEGESTRFDYA